jgi:hypothetical protein
MDNMSESMTHTVLRCEQCNKPFDTTKQVKRHGYYCQSRLRGRQPISRARACLHCATSKVVCDKMLPSCARCITRGTECQYPAKTTRKTDSDTRRSQSHDSPAVSTDLEDSTLVTPSHIVSSERGMMDFFEDVLPQNFDVSLDILDPTDLDWFTPTFEFEDLSAATACIHQLGSSCHRLSSHRIYKYQSKLLCPSTC